MQSIMVVIDHTKADLAEISSRYSFHGATSSGIDANTSIVVVAPRHAHARFALADEPGVTVLPGAHNPAPIGAAAAAALAHVAAKPEETMHEVALRLHAVHGPAYHPDVV